MFSDTEKAGNLRVGAAWSTPGIYSEKGDVVVGSQSNNVWLYGKVAISTQGDAAKRNQPETLYVDGRIKATGTVDGDMKVVYQRDDDPTDNLPKTPLALSHEPDGREIWRKNENDPEGHSDKAVRHPGWLRSSTRNDPLGQRLPDGNRIL